MTINPQILEQVQAEFLRFLREFKLENEINPHYVNQVEEMKDNELTTLFVDFGHLISFNDALSDLIQTNYYKFETQLRTAVAEFVKDIDLTYVHNEDTREDRPFYISFTNFAVMSSIRDIRANLIGQLLCISGTVTRTSEVRPELLIGAFKCKICGHKIGNVVQNFQYTEPSQCPERTCNNHSRFELLNEQSTFVDWQRVLVQENPSEVPSGSMPRTIEIIIRNDLVESCKPGDRIVVVGTPVAIPEIGRKALGDRPQLQRPAGFEVDGVAGIRTYGSRDLTYHMSFLANSIKQFEDDKEEVTNADKSEIVAIRNTPDLYNKLARSIAPNVYAHDEVKRGILLMLLGGVQKTTVDNIKQRGDINICIVGDPSTAKSQFLKFVANFMPRAIYTSGQSSTAAGLTATVTKDVETGDFTIEAGAMMLADNGICCIDEFDKMNINDQVAIHEAMEQQTISIAKAGIHATLNARASVLAAANPISGRYDRSKSLRANLNLSAAIMSRFDLFFVVVDDCNPEADLKIAEHIFAVHKGEISSVEKEHFSPDELKRYIKFTKTLEPQITDEARAELVKSYNELRQEDSVGITHTSYRITVRQLEALIRLSEALAKMNLDSYVKPKYVQEATRLLKKSIIQVEAEAINLDMAPIEETQVEKQQQRSISFEQYNKYAKIIIYYLKEQEQETEPVKQNIDSICDWWMEDNKDSYQLEGEIGKDIEIVKLVINRLIDVDHVLIKNDDETISVHPNYTDD